MIATLSTTKLKKNKKIYHMT